MNGRKVIIDQALCRKVELLIKGGAPHAEVAQICGISAATVSRIKTAGFSAEQFMMNNDKRREADHKKRLEALDKAIDEVRSDTNATEDSLRMAATVAGQIAGQMEMDLHKPVHSELNEMTDQAKMMRFVAGQVNRLLNVLEDILTYAKKAGGA